MKILLVGPGNSPHFIRWFTWFRERGIDVSLVSTLEPKSMEDNIYVLPNPERYRIPGYGILTRSRVYSKFDMLVKRIKPDIIALHYCNDPVTYKLDFHPFVLHCWGSDVKTGEDSKLYKFLKTNISKADLIIAGDIGREIIIERFDCPKKKIDVIPWGIDLNTFRLVSKEELRKKLKIDSDEIVFFASRGVSSKYCPEIIIKAFNSTVKKKDEKNLRLILLKAFATDDEIRFVDELIKKSGNKKITFIKKLLSSNEMADYYNASDFYVAMPTDDEQSLSLPESMACGCVPILRDLDAYKKILHNEKNGFLVPMEQSALTNVMVKASGMNKELDPWRKMNRDFIEQELNWDTTAEKIFKGYKKLIKKQ